jgi:MSHA biogenesis protein MshQ
VAGAGNFTVDLALSRAAAADGPFESFRLGVLPADTDGVTLRAADLNLDTTVPADGNDRVLVGSSKIRFGRLALKNANGSQLVALPVRIEAQYAVPAGTGWVFITNKEDSCTSIANNNLQMNNFTANLSWCKTALTTTPVTLSGGRGMFMLSPPGNANNGSVLVTANLSAAASGQACTAVNAGTPFVAAAGADKTYLRGNWAGSTYVNDPSARVTFGTFKGAEEVIYMRENF